MLNKVFIFLSILLLCCSCSRNLNSNTSSDISGTWYQVEINLFNDTSSHMYAPVKWTFDKGRCRINISDSKEYEFSTEDNKLSFSPVKGAIYEEWDQKIFLSPLRKSN